MKGLNLAPRNYDVQLQMVIKSHAAPIFVSSPEDQRSGGGLARHWITLKTGITLSVCLCVPLTNRITLGRSGTNQFKLCWSGEKSLAFYANVNIFLTNHIAFEFSQL